MSDKPRFYDSHNPTLGSPPKPFDLIRMRSESPEVPADDCDNRSHRTSLLSDTAPRSSKISRVVGDVDITSASITRSTQEKLQEITLNIEGKTSTFELTYKEDSTRLTEKSYTELFNLFDEKYKPMEEHINILVESSNNKAISTVKEYTNILVKIAKPIIKSSMLEINHIEKEMELTNQMSRTIDNLQRQLDDTRTKIRTINSSELGNFSDQLPELKSNERTLKIQISGLTNIYNQKKNNLPQLDKELKAFGEKNIQIQTRLDLVKTGLEFILRQQRESQDSDAIPPSSTDKGKQRDVQTDASQHSMHTDARFGNQEIKEIFPRVDFERITDPAKKRAHQEVFKHYAEALCNETVETFRNNRACEGILQHYDASRIYYTWYGTINADLTQLIAFRNTNNGDILVGPSESLLRDKFAIRSALNHLYQPMTMQQVSEHLQNGESAQWATYSVTKPFCKDGKLYVTDNHKQLAQEYGGKADNMHKLYSSSSNRTAAGIWTLPNGAVKMEPQPRGCKPPKHGIVENWNL